MKNRRIACSILVVLLICVMVLPASAASSTHEDVYDECNFATYTTCNVYNYSAIIEFLSIRNTNSEKHIMTTCFIPELLPTN